MRITLAGKVAVAGGLVLLGGGLIASQALASSSSQPTGDAPYAINVTASPYDAACDGSTDDTTAIQDALNAAGNAGGGIVQIPVTGHDCKITSTLTIPADVILEGEGPQAANSGEIWFDSSGNGPAVQIGPTTGNSPVDYHGGGLQNIGIVGNGASLTGQVGVQVESTVNAYLSDVEVTDVGIGYQVNGGGTSDWDGETQMVDPMTSNVDTGLEFTDSGGETTDFRLTGGYFSGESNSAGYGIYAQDLHSSQLEGYSAESFSYGTYLTTGTQDNQFFGGRMENSGSQNGTASYVCSGSGVTSTFWGALDADTGSTSTLQNLSGAACTQHS